MVVAYHLSSSSPQVSLLRPKSIAGDDLPLGREGGEEVRGIRLEQVLGTEESDSVRNALALGNRKSDGRSSPKYIYFSQITVSLYVGYLSSDLSAHFAIKDAAIFLFCHHPNGGPHCYKMTASFLGITTTSKDRKQDIGPKASL